MDAWALTWTIVGIGFPAIISIGFAFVLVGPASTPGEIRFAKCCFVAPTVILGATELAWLFSSNASPWLRWTTGILIGIIVFVGLPETLRWITGRQKLAPPQLHSSLASRESSTGRPSESASSVGKPHLPAPAQLDADEAKRRAAMIVKLRNLYILGHDDISSKMLAGLEDPPAAWINEQLEKMGEHWRVAKAAAPAPSIAPSRLAVTGFNFPSLDPANPDSDRGYKFTIVNNGEIAADAPLTTAIVGLGTGAVSQEEIRKEVQMLSEQARPAENRTDTQIDPKKEGAVEFKHFSMTNEDLKNVLSGKMTAVVVAIFTYKDDSLNKNQYWITEFAGSMSGNDDIFTLKYNKTHLNEKAIEPSGR